jgi:glycerol-1-phosphate dehydrogenase [NAD(P)+]
MKHLFMIGKKVMTSGQRWSKPKAALAPVNAFLSSSEPLIASLPVENMSTHPAPRRILGTDATVGIAERFAELSAAQALLLVCDDTTWQAAGEMLRTKLANRYTLEVLSLGRSVRATQEMVDRVAAAASSFGVILAVGAGTINDICKAAASARNMPYIAYATAASMNGYCSASASIEHGDVKHSLAAKPPIAIVADTCIIVAAPARLTRAGVGDTLCRTVVEADMLLSHHLLGTPYPRAIFDRLRSHEASLISGTINARGSEVHYAATLMEALLDAGDAMREFGSSAVASQGEHMIAHTLEMKYGSEMHDVLHGELIAITSLTSSQLQHRLLLTTPIVKHWPYELTQFERLFGNHRAQALADRYHKKLLSKEQAADISARLKKCWPEVSNELAAIMLPTATLERAFIHSGLSTKPTQLNIAEERYRFGASYAHLTRERFTFLDVAAMNTKRVA